MVVETKAQENRRFEVTVKEHDQMLHELQEQLRVQGEKV